MNVCLILVTALTLSACSGSHHKPTTTVAPDIASKVKPVLTLETLDFAADVEVSKVKAECSMLEKLELSILESAKKYEVEIDRDSSSTQALEDQYVLRATYVEVIANKWRFPSVRPSSSAIVKADILKNGEVLKTTSKAIGSGVALGACDRLEKVAIAGGRYISKWASTQNYK